MNDQSPPARRHLFARLKGVLAQPRARRAAATVAGMVLVAAGLVGLRAGWKHVRTDRVLDAVAQTDVVALRRSLASGGDPNATTPTGRSALGTAAVLGDSAAVRTLLDAGATTTTRNQFGRTPLALAAFGDRTGAAVRLLVRSGADVNSQDRFGESPVVTAVMAFNPAAVALLLDAGADPNGGPRTASALGGAVLTRQVSLVRALVRAGADWDRPLDPPNEMHTVRDLARRVPNREIQALAESRLERP